MQSFESTATNTLFIAVEGHIGAGKALLTTQLASHLNASPVIEPDSENPFLKQFYQDPNRYGLQTQLHFLFTRQQLLIDLQQGNLFNSRWVCDFLIDKDLLFAEENLNQQDFRLYDQIHKQISIPQITPDLVIFLECSNEHTKSSMQQQGFDLSDHYIKKMNEAYTRYFHFYDQSPLLIINSNELDFDNPDEITGIMTAIQNLNIGRQYYNPTPISV